MLPLCFMLLPLSRAWREDKTHYEIQEQIEQRKLQSLHAANVIITQVVEEMIGQLVAPLGARSMPDLRALRRLYLLRGSRHIRNGLADGAEHRRGLRGARGGSGGIARRSASRPVRSNSV